MSSIEKPLRLLIEYARAFGTNEVDINNALDLLEHYEYGLCFDTIITQMYEYEIKIDKEVFNLICNIGAELKIDEKDYKFMKELVE